MNDISYRIIDASGNVKYAGTDMPSWFDLEKANALVNRGAGEKVFAFNMKISTTRAMFEVC